MQNPEEKTEAAAAAAAASSAASLASRIESLGRKVQSKESQKISSTSAPSSRNILSMKSIAPRTWRLAKKKLIKKDKPDDPTDLLCFLKQHKGWMGKNGCLVPPNFCHEWDEGRTNFSVTLERVNDYFREHGLRPGELISAEDEGDIMINWTDDLETLCNLPLEDGKEASKTNFQSELNQYIQLVKTRVPRIQQWMSECSTGCENLGLAFTDSNMKPLWGSRRQYAFGKTLTKLLFHHKITDMELSPIFGIFLFPTGGANGPELHADFYTGELHNPAVIKRIMHDAFGYMEKFHDIENEFNPPRIYVQRGFRGMLGDGTSTNPKKVHKNWKTFTHLVKKRLQEAKEAGAGEAVQVGRECLEKIIHGHQPWYCHEFEEVSGDTGWTRSPFSLVLEQADDYLFDQGLHPVFGIVKGGQVVDMTPEEFVEDLCPGDTLPPALQALLPYTVDEGEPFTVAHFKLNLIEYVKALKARAEVVRKKAHIKAEKLVKKYKDDPNFPDTADALIESCKQRQHWTVEFADGLKLTKENICMWGSRRQYAYGQTVAKLLFRFKATTLEMDPVFTMMLFPTGGIVGPGNTSLVVGDMSHAIVCHAIVHDAFGYLLNLHKLGPGYNYLKVCALFPTTSPLCCQLQGISGASECMKKWNMLGKQGRARRRRFLKLKKLIPSFEDADHIENDLAYKYKSRKWKKKKKSTKETQVHPAP